MRIILKSIGLFCLLQPVFAAMPKPFIVATNGNDQWSGILADPNRKKTDGPFATLSRAIEESRKTTTGLKAARPEILIRSGTHFLTHTLVLEPLDSGLVISAFRDEKPVLSAGRKIEGWKEESVDGKKLWVAEIPEVREEKFFFRELWVNGKRAIRARHPNQGYFTVKDLPDSTPNWEQGHSRFRFNGEDMKAWKTLTNAEVVVMTRWVESRLPLVGVDEKEHIASFGKKSVFQLAPGDHYYVEHAMELLDAPREWYLERATGKLYYLPGPEEKITTAEVIAPALPQILRLEGKPEAGQFVQHITLNGITFSHAEWYYPQKPAPKTPGDLEVGGFPQAAFGVPAAVWGEGVRNCIITNCRILHVGGYGLELARGCSSNLITRCEVGDLGAGGVKLGDTGIHAKSEEQATSNVLIDSEVHDGGQMFPSAVGLWIGESANNRIAHNLIHDFYYTGISIGWTWGYGPSLASNNVVEFNHVHHIGVKSGGDGPILSDMGGIYTLGMQPGTRIFNNLWHDIGAANYGGWGIYFDEGSSGIVAQSNVVYRTTHGGFHQHYGETNRVFNNIFAVARDAQLERTRVEAHRSFSFETNIVYFNTGSLLAGDWSGTNFVADWNVYFDARNPTNQSMKFGAEGFAQWQQRGHDQHSLIADPLFVDAAKDDFRLRPNSPALKLGFKPIDLSKVGVRGNGRLQSSK
jgi:hypothetical protein